MLGKQGQHKHNREVLSNIWKQISSDRTTSTASGIILIVSTDFDLV
jgi:hypothetical protein